MADEVRVPDRVRRRHRAARAEGRALADAARLLARRDATLIATAISEVARNIVVYAVRRDRHARRSRGARGAGSSSSRATTGPGIADIDAGDAATATRHAAASASGLPGRAAADGRVRDRRHGRQGHDGHDARSGATATTLERLRDARNGSVDVDGRQPCSSGAVAAIRSPASRSPATSRSCVERDGWVLVAAPSTASVTASRARASAHRRGRGVAGFRERELADAPSSCAATKALRETRGVVMRLAAVLDEQRHDHLARRRQRRRQCSCAAEPAHRPARSCCARGVVGYELPHSLQRRRLDRPARSTRCSSRRTASTGVSQSDSGIVAARRGELADRVLAEHAKRTDDALVVVARYLGAAGRDRSYCRRRDTPGVSGVHEVDSGEAALARGVRARPARRSTAS